MSSGVLSLSQSAGGGELDSAKCIHVRKNMNQNEAETLYRYSLCILQNNIAFRGTVLRCDFAHAERIRNESRFTGFYISVSSNFPDGNLQNA